MTPHLGPDSRCRNSDGSDAVTKLDMYDEEETCKTEGYYNDMRPSVEAECCPTDSTVFEYGKWWCLELPMAASCSFSPQCASKMCEPENSPDGKCVSATTTTATKTTAGRRLTASFLPAPPAPAPPPFGALFAASGGVHPSDDKTGGSHAVKAATEQRAGQAAAQTGAPATSASRRPPDPASPDGLSADREERTRSQIACPDGVLGHLNRTSAVCCPTSRTVRRLGRVWCADLTNGAQCSLSEQRTSRWCHTYPGADGTCARRQPAGSVIEWSQGTDGCESRGHLVLQSINRRH